MELTSRQVSQPERFFATIGAPATDHLRVAKTALLIFKEVLLQALTGPWRLREVFQQTVQIGIGSLPIVTVATTFAGLVVTQEVAWHMNEALHTVQMVPGFTSQFILRELGVAIPALLVVSKVGAAITAEVGSMKVTEQIDALKLLRINPVTYLVFPRWIACIFSVACLTMFSIAITLLCACGMAVLSFNFNSLEYINAIQQFVSVNDFICALVKSVVFGAMIPVVACAYGFHCRGGAQGVGSATTNAVVGATIILIILDFILTYTFSLIL